MKIHKLLYGITSLTLLILMIFPSYASATKPMVAVLPLDTSRAGDLAFTGPAIQQMLISRLASEELDVMPAGSLHSSINASRADYMVTGRVVKEPGDRVKVELELKSRGSQSPVEAWEIRPASIGSLVTETGRYSILIAQKISDIENQKTILSSFNDTSNNVQSSDEPLMEDEQLKLSRIHPDLLYRETPRNQKGSASPIDQVPLPEKTTSQTQADTQGTVAESGHEEQPGINSTSAATDHGKEKETQTGTQEDDNWPPDYPPSYDDEPYRQQKAEAGTTASEDDDSFAGDYPPDYESSSEPPQEARTANRKVGPKKKERSWWSYLWPFGNDQQKEDESNAVQEPSHHMPKPVPADRLPYPVPADINAAMEADSNPTAQTDLSASLAQPETSTYPSAIVRESTHSETEATGAESQAPHTTSLQDNHKAPGKQDMINTYNHLSDSVQEGAVEQDQGDHEQSSVQDLNSQAKKYEKADDSAQDMERQFNADHQATDGKSAQKTVTQKDHAPKHSGGWFSWLWPDSWKGKDSKPAGTKANKALDHKDKQSVSDSYKASSEPSPEQNGTKGPVWVWN